MSHYYNKCGTCKLLVMDWTIE